MFILLAYLLSSVDVVYVLSSMAAVYFSSSVVAVYMINYNQKYISLNVLVWVGCFGPEGSLMHLLYQSGEFNQI